MRLYRIEYNNNASICRASSSSYHGIDLCMDTYDNWLLRIEWASSIILWKRPRHSNSARALHEGVWLWTREQTLPLCKHPQPFFSISYSNETSILCIQVLTDQPLRPIGKMTLQLSTEVVATTSSSSSIVVRVPIFEKNVFLSSLDPWLKSDQVYVPIKVCVEKSEAPSCNCLDCDSLLRKNLGDVRAMKKQKKNEDLNPYFVVSFQDIETRNMYIIVKAILTLWKQHKWTCLQPTILQEKSNIYWLWIYREENADFAGLSSILESIGCCVLSSPAL